jgi:hypothetical protein
VADQSAVRQSIVRLREVTEVAWDSVIDKKAVFKTTTILQGET